MLNPCSTCGSEHADGELCPSVRGLRVGTVVDGKYELVRLIGQGGMGEVYEGRHRVIGRRVAVKFLLNEYARHPEVAVRFENEARAAGGSEHENVAGVYDVGSLADGTKYLVMEFLDGEDIDRLLQREAPLAAPRAAFIVIQACRGLDVVHQRGIVHRDLKPANLFLVKRADKSDLVKVLDFGIAKLRSLDGKGTKTGAAIGTASYMSPEQARGERDVDCRSDVYSLGVILYELLSGKTPHEGDSLLQILHKVMTQAPVELETLRPGLPAEMYALVRRAMAASPEGRYQSAAELGDALLPFVGRPLAAIRSHPGVGAGVGLDATVGIDLGTAAAPGSHPLPAHTRSSGSMVGVARSEPGTPPVTLSRGGLGRALIAAGVVGAIAVTAVVAFFALPRTRATGITPMQSAGGLVFSADSAPMLAMPTAPATSATSAPTPTPIVAPATSAPSTPSPRPPAPAVTQSAPRRAATTRIAPAATPSAGPVPVPPKPAAVDRSSNPF